MRSSFKSRALVHSYGLSHPGLVRENNEDAVFVTERIVRNDLESHTFGIYLVADGMGGHPGGEVASTTAMLTISRFLIEKMNLDFGSISPSHLLVQAIQNAHDQILDIGRKKPELKFMGTTVTVGLRIDQNLFLGHIGDCRAYLVRDSSIRHLTEDHSVIAGLIKSGAISEKEAVLHPERGRILRSLGITPTVVIDTTIKDTNETKLTLLPKDILLLCSDGLTTSLSDVEILSCLDLNLESEQACLRLVEMANHAGGSDNISVIIVNIKAYDNAIRR
jgi:PPM family protein phosphatase